MKFTEEYVMIMEKYVLLKKMFSNGRNVGLLLRAGVEKTGVETHWLTGKEKVPDTTVRKESHVDSLPEHERTLHN